MTPIPNIPLGNRNLATTQGHSHSSITYHGETVTDAVVKPLMRAGKWKRSKNRKHTKNIPPPNPPPNLPPDAACEEDPEFTRASNFFTIPTIIIPPITIFSDPFDTPITIEPVEPLSIDHIPTSSTTTTTSSGSSISNDNDSLATPTSTSLTVTVAQISFISSISSSTTTITQISSVSSIISYSTYSISSSTSSAASSLPISDGAYSTSTTPSSATTPSTTTTPSATTTPSSTSTLTTADITYASDNSSTSNLQSHASIPVFTIAIVLVGILLLSIIAALLYRRHIVKVREKHRLDVQEYYRRLLGRLDMQQTSTTSLNTMIRVYSKNTEPIPSQTNPNPTPTEQ